MRTSSTLAQVFLQQLTPSCTQKQHLSCCWCWWRVIHCKSRLQRRFAPHPSGLGWAGLGRNINLPQHTTHDAQPGPCMTRPCRENKCNPKLQIFFILLDILSGPSLSLCVLVIHNTCTLGGDRGTWTVWKFLKEGLHLHNMMQKPRDNLFLTLPMNICIALFTVCNCIPRICRDRTRVLISSVDTASRLSLRASPRRSRAFCARIVGGRAPSYPVSLQRALCSVHTQETRK